MKRITISLLVLIFLSSCSSNAVTPTVTLLPSNTPLPTQTPVPSATLTTTPSPLPEPTPPPEPIQESPLCATGAEADQGLCMIPLEDAIHGVPSEMAKLNAPPVSQEILDGLDEFQPKIISEYSAEESGRIYQLDSQSRKYYEQHPKRLPIEVVGYFSVPKTEQIAGSDMYPGRVWRWTFKLAEGTVVSRYITVMYAPVSSQASLDSIGVITVSELKGNYTRSVPPAQMNPLVVINKDKGHNDLLANWEAQDVMPEEMEKMAFVGISMP